MTVCSARKQRVDVLARRPQAAAGAYGSGYFAPVAPQDGGPGLGHPRRAHPEEAKQVRMRAEAAMAHTDAELGAEAGGDEAVVHPFDGEGSHGQGGCARGGDRSQDMHAVDGSQPLVQLGRQRRLVPRDRVPADAVELIHGGAEGDGADHVGRAGLLALGRFGPDDLVQVDQVHGAATGEEGIP